MTTSTRSKDAFGLNDEQRAAVEHRDGPLLVVAGAGTGKTRVITERIRALLESDPNLAGENILGLTFTDKSAGEMKYRVVKSIGERAEGVWLSTFHKFCLEKILRPANPDIQPLDDIDHRILLRRNIAELGLVHFWRLAEPAEFLRDFVTFFSRCQDELVTPDDYQRYAEGLRRKHDARKAALDPDTVQIAEDEVARQEELARVYRVSERLLRDRNLHTFGAQILQSVELLRNDAALLDQMRGQYRYILVDEFQDTNIAQLELLWLLSAKHRNIMVVGDHNQAIYRFRGASYGSFTTFLQRFCETNAKGAAPATKKFLVSLAQNYRSTKRILNVADAVIRNNEQSPLIPQNALRTDNRDGEKIRVVEFGMPEEEAQWVASEIDRMHLAGAPWRSFAVLYRRHTHRNQLLDALRRKRIPFVIRKFSILTSTVVRDLLAYLKLIANPSDNVACARVLAAPYWRAEPRDLVRLAERSEKNHRRPIWDEIESALREDPTDGLPINRWREETRLSELVELVHTLRQAARRKSATELLDDLIRSLELAPLPSEADRQYLERFVAFVGEWERKSEDKRLRDFIEYLGYFNELDGDICLDEEVAEDAVQLMTVHSAKGLEFPHVFILRLAKGDFPTGSRRPVFEFPAELMKEERPEGDFQIQEERRLFYVALTRARQNLTLSTVINKRKKPSPFLDDFLMDPKVQKFDVAQSAPRVVVPPSEDIAGPAPDSADPSQLFGPRREDTRAYSRIALWAKAFHPPRREPLQLSASAIDAYERCPMKYMFQYMWNLRGSPHAQITFGNVMHTTVKECVGEIRKGRSVPFEEVMSIYEREWSAAGFIDEFHEREYHKAGREQLEVFHRSYCAAPADVLHQEKSFELPLDHEVVVTGRIDQINRMPGGEVEIVDYKTGRPRDAKKADADLQLSVYALAAQEVLDLIPGRLVFYNLGTNEAVGSTRDKKTLAAVKQKIAEVADQIRAGEFSPKPGFACGYCDFKPLCPAHEQLINIQSAIQIQSAERPA
jgi:DNA helicase II / ATP-dependent DNA helicase PcrA